MSRLFAALYVSDRWYFRWQHTGLLHNKARAIVLFDRILTRGEHCIELNGQPLDNIIDRP